MTASSTYSPALSLGRFAAQPILVASVTARKMAEIVLFACFITRLSIHDSPSGTALGPGSCSAIVWQSGRASRGGAVVRLDGRFGVCTNTAGAPHWVEAPSADRGWKTPVSGERTGAFRACQLLRRRQAGRLGLLTQIRT